MNKAMMTAAIALAVGLAGCGKKETPPPTETAAADTAATPAAPAPAAPPTQTAIPIDPGKPNACDKLTDVKLAATIESAKDIADRVAAMDRCEQLHGRTLAKFHSYAYDEGRMSSGPNWKALAEACRTGKPI